MHVEKLQYVALVYNLLHWSVFMSLLCKIGMGLYSKEGLLSIWKILYETQTLQVDWEQSFAGGGRVMESTEVEKRKEFL